VWFHPDNSLSLLSAYIHRDWLRGAKLQRAVALESGKVVRGRVLPGLRDIVVVSERDLNKGEELQVLVDDDNDGRFVGYSAGDELRSSLRWAVCLLGGLALCCWGALKLRKVGKDTRPLFEGLSRW